MCGITGYGLSDPQRRAEEAPLRAMMDTLVHRGPDDAGVHLAGPIALGFRRLSVIDLAGGHQPLFNEAGDVAVVMNGEIYNFRELRAGLTARGHTFRCGSDAEVLVHLYEERGAGLVDDLVGMFAFAILDERAGRHELLLARDRLGIKPLYYAETAEGIAFGSEPKAVLARGWTRRRLRPEALLDYLVQGYAGGEHAAWEGMRRLPPGSVLAWRPGERAAVRRYWDLPTGGLRGPAALSEVREWIDRAVADRLIADVPLGAFLSGGVDSTAVVTSMARASATPPVVCTVGFRERSHDELEIARRTAARLGLVHHTAVLEADPAAAIEILPWFFDEPHADPSTLPTWLVSRMAREHVTVALSGDGGDEIFAGYRRYVHDAAEHRVRRAIGPPGRALARAAGAIWPRLEWAPRFVRGRTFLRNVGDDPARAYWRSVTHRDRSEAVALLPPDLAARLAEHDPFATFAAHYRRPAGADSLYRAQYADFHTYLPDQILAKVDRASMAVALEVRVPLLDHRLVGRFANLPAKEKVRGGRGKLALRAALAERVPAEILRGPKRGFDTPLDRWIRGPLRAAVAEAIETLPADWLRRDALRAALAAHDGGRRRQGRLLWSVLVLEHWRRRHGVEGLAG
ncbi:MAG: asparagine synthase (glutamine-hydrolyzing) [Planctomycetota bacterium]